jgi:hypothetical protein
LLLVNKDLGNIDLSAVPVPITFREVIEQRRAEIEICLKAKASPAVIFIVVRLFALGRGALT